VQTREREEKTRLEEEGSFVIQSRTHHLLFEQRLLCCCYCLFNFYDTRLSVLHSKLFEEIDLSPNEHTFEERSFAVSSSSSHLSIQLNNFNRKGAIFHFRDTKIDILYDSHQRPFDSKLVYHQTTF
jgi:hypothetical protein